CRVHHVAMNRPFVGLWMEGQDAGRCGELEAARSADQGDLEEEAMNQADTAKQAPPPASAPPTLGDRPDEHRSIRLFDPTGLSKEASNGRRRAGVGAGRAHRSLAADPLPFWRLVDHSAAAAWSSPAS